jgi:hypothetical protein
MFNGRVRSMKGETARGVIAIQPSDEPGADTVPVPGAKIACEGCPMRDVAVDGEGRFFVNLGQSYDAARPIVLHVTAPGFEPLDIDVPRPPATTQSGLVTIYAFLRPVRTREVNVLDPRP